MSKRFIATDERGLFLTPRRATKVMYESRSGWSESLDDARVFSTSGAAKNSARQAGVEESTILQVVLKIVDPEYEKK